MIKYEFLNNIQVKLHFIFFKCKIDIKNNIMQCVYEYRIHPTNTTQHDKNDLNGISSNGIDKTYKFKNI